MGEPPPLTPAQLRARKGALTAAIHAVERSWEDMDKYVSSPDGDAIQKLLRARLRRLRQECADLDAQ